MVMNLHHTPTYLEDRVLVGNANSRVPMMAIPQPPSMVDLKINYGQTPVQTDCGQPSNKKTKFA